MKLIYQKYTPESLQRVLQGKYFISTRPAGKSQQIKQFFNQFGAELKEFPMIEIRPCKLSRHEAGILQNTTQYEWLVFTSQHAVELYFQHFSCKPSKHTQLASIGQSTTLCLKNYGHTPHFQASKPGREYLAHELKQVFGNTKPNVLWPAGNLAPNAMIQSFDQLAQLTRVNIYNTLPPKTIDAQLASKVKNKEYDMLFFFSPSAVRNFYQLFKNHLAESNIYAAGIGKSSVRQLTQLNIQTRFHAEMNTESFIDSCCSYYLNNKKTNNNGLSTNTLT